MSDKPLFKIVPGSIVKATKGGYLYCQTDPPHPHGETRGDRKAKYIYLHIARKELELGRYLDLKKEQVHHKDKDKTNNSPSNLELTVKGEHQHDHAMHGNSFWKSSPRTKPRKHKKRDKDAALRVVLAYLRSF